MSKHTPLQLRTAAADRVSRGHPWIFKDGLERGFRGNPGEPVLLTDVMGKPLAVGLAEPNSDLAVRVFGGPNDNMNPVFFAKRINEALLHRKAWGVRDVATGWRWLHGENDRLPGFSVDMYGRTAVLKLDAPYEKWVPLVSDAIRATGEADGILLRGEPSTVVWGDVPESGIVMEEYGLKIAVDVWKGQKTGMFLDQRENRHWVRAHASGRTVLNLFSYTGGFSLAALRGGAKHVTSVDTAAQAFNSLQESLGLNGFDTERHTAAVEDCYLFLQKAREKRMMWDMIILDPPSLGHNQASMPKALRAYEKLNAAAMKVLANDGILCTASCTSRLDSAEFQALVRRAAVSTNRTMQVIHEAGAGADHPVLLAFPEGRYLKFLALQAST